VGLHPCSRRQVVCRQVAVTAGADGLLWHTSGLYLKEHGEYPVSGIPSLNLPGDIATEIEGTFRVNGSNKRMRDLQAIFETPPRASSANLSLPK
jgi:hypothetical protein